MKYRQNLNDTRVSQLINVPMIDEAPTRELYEILRNVCTEIVCFVARISRTGRGEENLASVRTNEYWKVGRVRGSVMRSWHDFGRCCDSTPGLHSTTKGLRSFPPRDAAPVKSPLGLPVTRDQIANRRNIWQLNRDFQDLNLIVSFSIPFFFTVLNKVFIFLLYIYLFPLYPMFI